MGSRRLKDGAAAEVSIEELAALARAGSRTSFDELVQRLRPGLVAFLARRVPSAAEAEDVAQETFLRAYERLDRYDPARPFPTWLFTIGKTVAANHVEAGTRRAAHEQASAAEPVVPPAPEIAEAADAARANDLWRRAAEVLPAGTYRVLWLRYVQNRSVREIAAEMDRSSVAIKVMLFRARRRLQQEVR